MSREIMHQALAQLKRTRWASNCEAGYSNNPVIAALEAELAKPEMPTKIFGPNLEQILNAAGFYRREWVGLTDEEILSAAEEVPITCIRQRDYDLHFAPIIESKLKEKNNA